MNNLFEENYLEKVKSTSNIFNEQSMFNKLEKLYAAAEKLAKLKKSASKEDINDTVGHIEDTVRNKDLDAKTAKVMTKLLKC